MPDLVTHLCVAQIAGGRMRRPFFAVFALGAILPDILSRPFHILFPGTSWFVAPMHSIAGCALWCALISLLFAPGLRGLCFGCLAGGAALHLALDSLQKQTCPVYYFWLLPFSWRTWGANLFWPEQALAFLPVTIAVAIAVAFVKAGGRLAVNAGERRSGE